MENRFSNYLVFEKENNKIVRVDSEAFNLSDEAFLLFKDLFDYDHGSIEEDGNLVAIHTGGWSENEFLVREFKETTWWFKNHEITTKGGHYYFDTDFYSKKKWQIVKNFEK